MFRNLAAAKFDFENSFHINNITKKKLVFFFNFSYRWSLGSGSQTVYIGILYVSILV